MSRMRIARGLVLLIGLVSAPFVRRRRSEEPDATRSRWRMPGGIIGWAVAALVLGSLAGVAGLIVAVSGIVPIKASSGHWAITAWFLDFAKSRSVAAHTWRTTVPALDSERLAVIGASHYQFACRPCHGSPGLEQPRIAGAMTPRPPDLQAAARTFAPEELFYIVKHGIKFTGMPAWPTQQRDDEVWAMVAFLRRLPGLSAQEYNRLAGAAEAAPDERPPLGNLLGPSLPVPDAVAEHCARCHGIDGLGRGSGAFPRLAGQRFEYLSATLVAYARGERHSGIMEPVAASLGLDDIGEVSAYYAGLPAPPAALLPERTLSEGREIATRGAPDRQVPACRECHGPGPPRNPNYPRLAGQYADYLELQLSLFRGHARGGTAYHTLMHKVAGQLTPQQVRAVAAYYAALPPER